MTRGDKAELLPEDQPTYSSLVAQTVLYLSEHGWDYSDHNAASRAVEHVIATVRRAPSPPSEVVERVRLALFRSDFGEIEGWGDAEYQKAFDTSAAAPYSGNGFWNKWTNLAKAAIAAGVSGVPEGWTIQRKHGRIVASHPDHGGTVCGLEPENVPDQILEALCADLLAAAPER